MKVQLATQASLAAYIGINRSTLISYINRNLSSSTLSEANINAVISYYSHKQHRTLTLDGYKLTLTPTINVGSSIVRHSLNRNST